MSSPPRLLFIDLLRTLAIVMMVIFHFCYDLALFGYNDWDFNRDPFWLQFRTVIVSCFTTVVGMSLILANRQTLRWPRVWRRTAILALCSGAITLSTYWVFQDKYVTFGILHFILVASLLGLLFLRLYWMNLVLAVVCILLGSYYTNPVFNSASLNWIGMAESKRIAVDYVPILPWFGPLLLGMFIMQWYQRSPYSSKDVAFAANSTLKRAVEWVGGHSLLIYMVHQPLLFSGFYLLPPLR